MANNEFGWVIERNYSSRLRYWTGRNDSHPWSLKPEDAVRFARRADAEARLTWHCGDIGRVVQYGWIGSSASPPAVVPPPEGLRAFAERFENYTEKVARWNPIMSWAYEHLAPEHAEKLEVMLCDAANAQADEARAALRAAAGAGSEQGPGQSTSLRPVEPGLVERLEAMRDQIVGGTEADDFDLETIKLAIAALRAGAPAGEKGQ